MTYTDHRDEDGYRACLFSDDLKELDAFAEWLKDRGIGCDYDGQINFDHEGTVSTEIDSVMTEWITDPAVATLLKLTWGRAK